MKLDYVVHSANPETVSVEAKTETGRVVTAQVPMLVVELIDGDKHGHTFRFASESDDHMADLVALFQPGKAIVATFAEAAAA